MFQSARGMQDHLPNVTPYWALLESYLRDLAKHYGYQEIRIPIIEQTGLFQHSIGTVTDIVEKEMYHLASRKRGKIAHLSLRPEGTAGCVRAAIEHQLVHTFQKLWYLGPMFRYERPQKGRYREFHQFGVEVFGISSPEIEVELITMTQRLWKRLMIDKHVHLEINSLGSYEARKQYHAHLVNYFKKHYAQLDEDSQRRLGSNPLRILDSKNPDMAAINEAAPKLLNYLDETSAKEFSLLQNLLQSLNIPFTINSRLVRGLDYYNKTVFEWVMSDSQGAQNTICGGGRYNDLVKKLGGPATSAVGFSIGLERLLALWMQTTQPHLREGKQLYVIQGDKVPKARGLQLAERLRDTFPSLSIQVDCIGGSFSKQFRRASAQHAFIALVLGEEEVKSETITLKHLTINQPQRAMAWPSLVHYLQKEYHPI